MISVADVSIRYLRLAVFVGTRRVEFARTGVMCSLAARVPCLNLRGPVCVRRYVARSAVACRRVKYEGRPIPGGVRAALIGRLCLGTLRVD